MIPTDVLALIGAVTGITGAVLGLGSFVRDRSRLVLIAQQVGTPTATGYEHLVRIYVANAGRQPIAITEVGLQSYRPSALRESIRSVLHRNRGIVFMSPIYSIYHALSDSEDPVVIKPGELKKFVLSAVAPNLEEPSGDLLWSYATDYRGSTRFGNTIAGLGASDWVPVATEPEPVYRSGAPEGDVE